MRIVLALFTGFVTVACGGPVTCAPGEVPNEVLQGCVIPKQCDGGTVNERNECEWPADAGAAVDVASDGGSFSQRVESGQTRRDTAGEAGVAGPAGDASVEQIADAGSERDAASGAAGSVAVAAPVCGNGKREGTELCDGDCPTECPNNDNDCLRTSLEGSAATCDARCTMMEITECHAADGCCPMGCDHGTDADCSPSCGDGVLTAPEKCEPGSADHPCPSAADCDDGNSCTTDRVTGAECSEECANTPITQPANGDRCCPRGANSTTDDDCEAECGNGIREGMELCDGADCPTSCDDGNPCTEDELVGAAASCNARCRHGSGTVNACGGCRALTNRPGSACMATLNSCVSSGMYECDGTEAVQCNARMPTGAAEQCNGDDDDCDGRVDEGVKNTCGGCTSLPAAVGASCFVEGVGCTNQGKYECDGTNALRCDAMPCLCGNGVVDAGESCDVMVPGGNPGSCPVACNDNDPCTTDRKVGSLCQTSCLFVPMGGTCNPQEPEPELPFRGGSTD